MDIEEWRGLINYWEGSGHDIRHLDIPQSVADELGIELPPREEPDMTEETTEATAADQTQATETLATEEPCDTLFEFKKKKYFDGTQCGLKGCSKKLPVVGSYVVGIKPTKNNNNGRIWYGPACVTCVSKVHSGMAPDTLAMLAHQRNGKSDLALVLDIEVGVIERRLLEAGIDENGQPLTGAITVSTAAVPVTTAAPQGLTLDQPDHAVIPVEYIESAGIEVGHTLAFLGTFHIQSQQDMDNAGAWLLTVKSKLADLDEMRLALGKPYRDMASTIQAHFKGTLDALKMAEGLLKQKITEGEVRAKETQQAAMQVAQQAHEAGNMQMAGQAAQQAAAADMQIPPTIIQYAPIVKCEVVDASQLPTEFWSPDIAKIQAAVDNGHRQIPGVRIWEEPRPVGSRAS